MLKFNIFSPVFSNIKDISTFFSKTPDNKKQEKIQKIITNTIKRHGMKHLVEMYMTFLDDVITNKKIDSYNNVHFFLEQLVPHISRRELMSLLESHNTQHQKFAHNALIFDYEIAQRSMPKDISEQLIQTIFFYSEFVLPSFLKDNVIQHVMNTQRSYILKHVINNAESSFKNTLLQVNDWAQYNDEEAILHLHFLLLCQQPVPAPLKEKIRSFIINDNISMEFLPLSMNTKKQLLHTVYSFISEDDKHFFDENHIINNDINQLIDLLESFENGNYGEISDIEYLNMHIQTLFYKHSFETLNIIFKEIEQDYPHQLENIVHFETAEFVMEQLKKDVDKEFQYWYVFNQAPDISDMNFSV